jgi:hypothetical protein
MSALVPVSLHLSKAQVRKAAQGRPIQISAANLHKGTHTIHVHPENHKKIQKAKRSGLFDWLKNAWNTVKNKVIDTPFYQQTVRPIAKQGVNQLIDNFVPSAARDVAHKAADFAGDKTGAFGLRHSVQRTPIPSGISHRVALSNNMSRMIGPEHPSFNPGLPLRPIGGEVAQRRASSAPKKTVRRRRKAGGSFLPSGY